MERLIGMVPELGMGYEPQVEIRREHFTVESALAELKKAEKDERSATMRKGEIFANAREALPLAQYERLIQESGYTRGTIKNYIWMYRSPGEEVKNRERGKGIGGKSALAIYRKLHALGPRDAWKAIEEFASANL